MVDRAGRRYPLDVPRWRGEDGSPLRVEPGPGITRDRVERGVRSQWRYAAALPLPVSPVSLGEGCTPLLTREFSGVEIGVKPEWLNPTGSFKDRGTTVMVSVLKAQGVPAILEDSSGNGGSSVAAYAAAAGMDATILTPASTSSAKIQQCRAHGARVERVPGDRQATADEAVRRAAQTFYAGHNHHPFFLQGTKLLAYEIWEDLGFTAPDAVLLPCGAGSLVLGCRVGFDELVAAGEIPHAPRLLVSQPEHCAPLVRVFHGRPAEPPRPTIAEGTAVPAPVRAPEVLDAVRATGGDMVAVPEAEIGPATLELARTGLYAEPTSAQVLPALRAFLAKGALDPAERVVTVLTGSALKAADAVAQLMVQAVP